MEPLEELALEDVFTWAKRVCERERYFPAEARERLNHPGNHLRSACDRLTAMRESKPAGQGALFCSQLKAGDHPV